MTAEQTHRLPLLGTGDGWLEIREKVEEGGGFLLQALWQGQDHAARDEDFPAALAALVSRLPPGVLPVMCGRCRFGVLDPFGANGRDDLSCYRDAKPLAAEIAAKGRGASAAALTHLYRLPVTAFDRCPEFAPVPADGGSTDTP